MNEKGLENRLMEIDCDGFPVEIKLYRLPVDASRWRVVARGEVAGASTVDETSPAPLLSLAANPPSADGCPEGWVVSDGVTLQRRNHKGPSSLAVRADGRVLLGRDRDFVVRPEFRGTEVRHAFQGGDLLVIEGLPFPALVPGLAYRSFVALDTEDRIVVGTTRAPIHAAELARALAHRTARDATGVKRLVQLQEGTCTWVSESGKPADEGCPPHPPPQVLLTVETEAAPP